MDTTYESVALWCFFLGTVAGVLVHLVWLNLKDTFKKSPEPEPREWTVPADKVEGLLELWTKWEKEDDRVARYHFWKNVEELLPEVKDVTCHVSFEDATKITIVEGDEND